METKLYNQAGDQIGTVQVSDYVFGITPNAAVMHQAMVRQLANARYGTHNTLDRGKVRGSTRKLYRQKGTGRARQGSIRAPHRRGGGIAHGPHPRSYEKKMPRKMRRLAVRSALSAKQASEQIRVVDELDFVQPRTKDMIALLEAHDLDGKTLIVLDERNENVRRSANNLPYVKTLFANYLNVVDLLSYDYVLMLRGALDTIEGYLGDGSSPEVTYTTTPAGAAPAASSTLAESSAPATSTATETAADDADEDEEDV
jgi:large subunit ribosomal protein L4